MEAIAAQKIGGHLNHEVPPTLVAAFFLFLVSGLGYAVYGLLSDLRAYGEGESLAIGAFVLLGVALLIALGFEFVNGFHDTANAVATVIYTRSMPPLVAVVWSGFFNFLGVALSTGAVAYTIVTMLPVDLILRVGSAGGYAMIFALLFAAVLWNLDTWWFGIPNSSSHALIGSVLGVGLANQLLGGGNASGVDWGQAWGVLRSLAFSPVCGFVLAGLLLLVMKALLRSKIFYQPAPSDRSPPWWIRGILILTCTAVSFAHGGNDGQKGMGVIMLILIGVAPTAYALNRTMPDADTPAFLQATTEAGAVFANRAQGLPVPEAEQARHLVNASLEQGHVDQPQVFAALASLTVDIGQQVSNYGTLRKVPAAQTKNLRNSMYLVAQATTALEKKKVPLEPKEAAALKTYVGFLNHGTRFIPTWVKVTVAIALGLGTMVGWKRIVITVGERIGKQHLSYGQGAAAEIVAAATIGGAEYLGLPVSTTHVLSSGVAGTMTANGNGLQTGTVRAIALAWVLTLPVAICLAGGLYALLRALFGGV